MKRPHPALVAVIVVAAMLVGAVAWGLIVRGEYETEQAATRVFTLDHDFTTVRKILVRHNAAQQLTVMGGGSDFIDQRLVPVSGEVESLKLLDPEWRLELRGSLRLRTRDEYVGRHEITLAQHVEITPDLLHSAVKLEKPAGRLRDYRMTTHFDRVEPATGATSADRNGAAAEPHSRVELTLSQRILTDAPWFAHGIADRRVLASVEKALANQEAAIRAFLAENLDDVPLLPLR